MSSKIREILESDFGWLKSDDVDLHIESAENVIIEMKREIVELIKGLVPKEEKYGEMEYNEGWNNCRKEIQKRIEEAVRVRNEAKEYYSICCGALMTDYPDSDFCPRCKEHTEAEEEKRIEEAGE